MKKPKLPNQKKAYKNLAKRLNGYTKKILVIYDTLAKEASKIATSTDFDGDGEFSFADYPRTAKKVNAMLDYYSNNMKALVYSGISDEWKNSNTLQDLLVKKVVKSFVRKVGENKVKAYYEHNNAAKKAFMERKVKGLNLSERIWNQREDVKEALEKTLSTSIEKGMSAVKLSKKVSKYLNDYPLLAKDYKKKFGKAITIQNCEYRSVRLARNEINMAYRSAEQERWERMDYIRGKEIKTTNNLNHKPDMCDLLAGVYPKDFYWTGWHVNCMCYAVPIIMSEEEYWSGKQPEKSMPSNFTEWVNDNKDKVSKSSYITQYARSDRQERQIRIASQNSQQVRRQLREYINEIVQTKLREVQLPNGDTAKRLYLTNDGDEYAVGRVFFDETMAKNIRNSRLSETIQVASHVDEWFPTAISDAELENGRHHDFQFKVFRATYQGKNILCKVKLTSENILYTMRLLN